MSPHRKLQRQAETSMAAGRLAEAAAAWERLCRLAPQDADAWTALGVVRRRLGDFAAAESACRQALALRSAHAPAQAALGAALQQQGRLQEAVAAYREALRLDPGLVEAQYFLANALREGGQLAEATEAYRRLLELDPDHFPGLNNLGTHLRNLGQAEEAIGLLQRALKLQPGHVATLTNLGDALVDRSRCEEAIELLQQAVRRQPDFANAWRALANALHHAGRLPEALDAYGEALARVPGWHEAQLGQAKVLEQLGEHQRARALLDPLLEAGHGGALSAFFDVSRHTGERRQAVDRIERVLGERPDMPDAAAAGFHFQLGRHYDESGDYETAFRHFQQANRLTPASYDRERQVRQVDDIITTWNPDFVQGMRCAANRSELPVFIVGMPRSGTSLVEQILASHPAVFGAGELSQISRIAQQFSIDYPGLAFPRFARYVTRESLDGAARRHLDELGALGGDAARVTDKMPYNLPYAGLIAQLFPRARIIQCQRHPLDTCLSCYFSDFGSIGHDYSYDLLTTGEFYIQYHRLMEHWSAVFPDRVLNIAYAELVQDQERQSRRLVEFCGLDWDPRCLEFHNSGRFVFTLSYEQVRQPMYTRSLGRWKHYERQLQPLRELLESAGIDCS
ncbi:MAG TPA: sulfotransferase family protein [Gammaproteobacteria bacterium]|nr:sulfotransferase family protein [Gammaproteobacteria bacterium]